MGVNMVSNFQKKINDYYDIKIELCFFFFPEILRCGQDVIKLKDGEIQKVKV